MSDSTSYKTYRILLEERQGKGFSETEVIAILKEILPQLAKLHRQGYFHGGLSLDTLIQQQEQTFWLPISPIPPNASRSEDFRALGITIIELLTAKSYDNDLSLTWSDYCCVSEQLKTILNCIIGVSSALSLQYANEILQALNFSLTSTFTDADADSSRTRTSDTQLQDKLIFPLWQFWLIGVGTIFTILLAAFLISPQTSKNLAIIMQNLVKNDALFPIEQNNKWGYFNKNGHIIIEPKFDLAYPFSEGLAAVVIDRSCQYIDRTSKVMINLDKDCQELGEFKEGLAKVKFQEKWKYINKQGKQISSTEFDEAASFSNGLALVKIGFKYAYIDRNGKIVKDWTSRSNIQQNAQKLLER